MITLLPLPMLYIHLSKVEVGDLHLLLQQHPLEQFNWRVFLLVLQHLLNLQQDR
ncbi:262R [Invertebrate iridescent virus 6]|uniref:262R n=1 Tax=Invertebrate iridescent virus 6 TaxID=176652 RepID=Q91FR1_IIV6|nr:262R [Invertebrate iridescent virus 6]AAK82123.1 262R [Invertebrate iridescent virus 6]QMS79546.1 hypothetical protein IIV6-T1_257 [Invertebrate iridescent virus 6]